MNVNLNARAALAVSLSPFLFTFFLATHVSADQVINDDLIVTGSACVGFDCVNGESFGFDTLRLKENNLRIKFMDTSSTGAFPRRDWRIRINESSNGGQNAFFIDDMGDNNTNGDEGAQVFTPFAIEAGAQNNSLVVSNSNKSGGQGGRIGLGTASPAVDLHTVSGDTPTVRLEQNNSAGFTPQTWDVAGNEVSFFVRDATNGSRLPLRIRPNAPSSSIDIAGTTGNVGFGTSSPDGLIHVRRTDAVSNRRMLHLENNGGGLIRFTDNSNSNAWDIGMVNNGNFRIFNSGNVALVQINPNNGNLETNGSFISNGTTLNVPDYVFEDDYRLMPLPELKEFVSRQKHLPNVPSEQEIKDNNLNLTEMQMRLLEKIEEGTLYTLQQEDQITLLRKHVAELRQMNSQLEARLKLLEAAQ